MAVNYGDKFRFSSVSLDDRYHVKIPTFFVGVRDNGHLYFHSGNFWNTDRDWMVKNTEWSLKSMNHSKSLIGKPIVYGDFVMLYSEKKKRHYNDQNSKATSELQPRNGNTHIAFRLFSPNKAIGEPVSFDDRIIFRSIESTEGNIANNHSLRVNNADDENGQIYRRKDHTDLHVFTLVRPLPDNATEKRRLAEKVLERARVAYRLYHNCNDQRVNQHCHNAMVQACEDDLEVMQRIPCNSLTPSGAQALSEDLYAPQTDTVAQEVDDKTVRYGVPFRLSNQAYNRHFNAAEDDTPFFLTTRQVAGWDNSTHLAISRYIRDQAKCPRLPNSKIRTMTTKFCLYLRVIVRKTGIQF